MGTSIIILTYNHLEKTKKCIESIKTYTKNEVYEIIVVDNNSNDDTINWLKTQSDITVIYNKENRGFPSGCNQGISVANKSYDILLLNNDTIVTTNWLTNLRKCLYSKSNIGAVGPVSNCNDNLQGASFTFKNFIDMQIKAMKNNISDSNRWEEKAFLTGFCLLIKREVIDKIKMLDERYSPGYIEDNDLALQILSSSYKLFLCHDSFVYHERGTSFREDINKFNSLILRNRAIFEDKWHFSCFEFDNSKNSSIFLANKPKDILDYNSSIGVSSLRIKYFFRNSNITLLEEDANKRKFSNMFFKTVSCLNELNGNTFDTIFIGNYLEKVDSPILFLNSLRPYLKDKGRIIGEFKNISYLKNINLLLSDNWYYENFNKQNNFTRNDIIRMALDSKYRVVTIYPFYHKEKESISSIHTNSSSIYYYSFVIEKI